MLTEPLCPRPLDGLSAPQQLLRDQVLYSPGDLVAHWFSVSSGVVRQRLHGADGKRHIIAFHLPGDSFGLEAEKSHASTVEAVVDAVVLRYSRQQTAQMARSHPTVSKLIHDQLRRGLAASQARLVVLGRLNAHQRVAAFLLEMSDRLVDGHDEFVLPMSRYDIGDYLGVSKETVDCAFTQLVAKGVIALPEPQHVRCRDRSLLEASSLLEAIGLPARSAHLSGRRF